MLGLKKGRSWPVLKTVNEIYLIVLCLKTVVILYLSSDSFEKESNVFICGSFRSKGYCQITIKIAQTQRLAFEIFIKFLNLYYVLLCSLTLQNRTYNIVWRCISISTIENKACKFVTSNLPCGILTRKVKQIQRNI